MILEILSMLLVSLLGVIINVYLFIRFATSKKRPFSSFHKLCLFKTVPNITICSIFSFYAVPLSISQMTLETVPRTQNLVLSQILGGIAYPLGPFIQICMAINRFIVLFFPFAKMKFEFIPITNMSILLCILLASCPVIVSVYTSCYLVYDPTILVFLPELEECAHSMDYGMFITICSLAAISNTFNVIIFAKLLKDKMGGMSENQKNKRRKKWVSMFTQSVLQDLLQVIDMTNYNLTSKLVDRDWWLFIFCCLSFATCRDALFPHRLHNPQRSQKVFPSVRRSQFRRSYCQDECMDLISSPPPSHKKRRRLRGIGKEISQELGPNPIKRPIAGTSPCASDREISSGSMATSTISVSFLIISNLCLFIVSLLGTVLNVYLFYKFSTRKGVVSGFYKLCLIKTIPNATVCACFLFWAVPLGSLRLDSSKVSRDVNVFVGQLAGAGAYILGPLLHVCMAANRFSSLYFAMQLLKISRFPITFISIAVTFAIAVLFTVMGLPEDCGFLYVPETLSWVSEDADCAAFQYNLLLYSIFGCAVISNSMNLATAGRLLFDKVGGMSALDSKRRRKKYFLNFSQSVLQDCLHVLDMINSTYTWKISPALWFQFLCLTFSFVSIHTLDGCVMFYFHTEVQPRWLWKKTVKKTLVRVVMVSRVSTASEPTRF